MDRRHFLLSAAAMAVPERPPNVLFLMPDQWHVDLVPTLLGLAGARVPKGMHGFDHLMMYTRTEDDEFAPWRGLRSSEYKYAEFRDKPWLLYDLEKDPYEMNNLADEPKYYHLVRTLHGAVKQEMERTADKWDEQHDAKLG